MGHTRLCLSLHTAYRCRQSGACCTAGWAIPVEGPIYERLVVHFGSRSRRERLFETGGPLPEGAAAILGTRPTGACVFFEEERNGLCAVHRELGAGLLPAACRQFPRVVLHDARGMLISLSHFCPTAAALLIAPSPFQIVTAPASLSLDGHLEGFDAREALPPLLSPQMLTTPDGYAAWERRAVGVLARGDLTAAQALDMIAAVTREVQAWRPGGRGLSDIVERVFDRAPVRDSHEDLEADERRSRLALASVPEGLSPPAPVQGFRSAWQDASRWWSQADGSVRAYLASRLFGNWVAYYGHGLHTVVEYLRICLAVLKMEAARRHVHTSAAATASSALSAVSPWQTNVIETLRNADLLLVHLSDTRALVQRLP